MLSLWSFFIHKRQFTILLVSALLASGIISLISIPKESAPEVKVPVGIVTTILPGASAADVEQLITKDIEDGLNNLENLDSITSTSRESVSSVVVQFDASADIDESIQKLKDAVDAVTSQLPSEAEDPTVTEISFSDQPVIIASVSGDYVPAELTRLSDFLQDELERLPGVSRVEVSGVQEREVQVVVDKEKLDQYGYTIGDVVSALQSANAALPVGSITVNDIDYALKFEGDIADPSEVGNIALPPQQGMSVPVYVRDVAFVSDGLSRASTFSRVSEAGQPAAPALTLQVFKSSGGNIVTTSNVVKERLADLEASGVIEGGAVVSYDAGKEVSDNLNELTRVGFETMALVMLSLILTIGWRESVVAGLSIPLSFLIAFTGLYASGNTLNFVSLFSLILAIGILVDSGIVVTEAIHTRMKLYATKTEAALAALREYAWPLIAGTMATVAVFAPLFFISGIVGEFIKSIPFTLIFVLIASIFVALGIVPLIAIMFTTTEQNRLERRQEEYTHAVQEWYRTKLGNLLDSRRTQNWFIVGMLVAFVLAVSLPISGLVKSVFFPNEDTDFIYVEIEKAEGTALGSTDIATRAVEEYLYTNPHVASFVTTVGAGSAFNQNSSSGSKVANITVMLPEDSEVTSSELAEELRAQFTPLTIADVRVYEVAGGPPSGAPVVITFSGDDLDELEQVVNRAEDVLADIEGTSEITTSTRGNNTEFTLTVDKAKATALGLNPAMIAQTLRTAVNGVTATTIRTPTDDIDVVVKMNLDPNYTDASITNRVNPDVIRALTMQTQNGPILLGSVLDVDLAKSNTAIRHEDGTRIETVSSYVTPGTTAVEVTNAFVDRVEELEIPDGVDMSIGGETEDVQRSFMEMGLAFVAGIVLMISILVLEFNSFRRSIYLISIVPLSLIGVFLGLLIMQQPLSFTSLLGMIALAGVIINHAIILMDSMERIHHDRPDLSHRDAVVEAAVSRLRPIFLTTITTVVGMIPLATVSAMWSPLAYAIMFGLTFAMLLTLVLIPILYFRWPGNIKTAAAAAAVSIK